VFLRLFYLIRRILHGPRVKRLRFAFHTSAAFQVDAVTDVNWRWLSLSSRLWRRVRTQPRSLD